MPAGQFSLRFCTSNISTLADGYGVDDRERHVIDEIAPAVRTRGYFTRPEFLKVCRWKSSRSQHQCMKNDDDFVRAVTTVALSSPNERLSVEVLLLLSGVAWPTASVLLHVGHRDPYPILDFRALWSLKVDADQETYDFEFWQSYVATCRRLAHEASVSMRELDRALWQFSKDEQRLSGAG